MMKKIISMLLVFVFVISTIGNPSCIFAQNEKNNQNGNYIKVELQGNYVKDELLVKFKSDKINLKKNAGEIQANSFGWAKNMQKIDSIKSDNIAVMKLEDNETVEEKINQLKSDPNVEYAEPNYIYSIKSFNDTNADLLWGLAKINRHTGVNIFSGISNQNITGNIVAIIDAGVAYDHPDLINNMWSGASCRDDNGNNLGGCVYGYDFADSDKNPYPVASSHGTHVAGTVAAEANNNKGIMGVNPNAKLMAVRVGNQTMTVANIVKGINFARQNGAKIINASLGGSDSSVSLSGAINNFKSVGGLFVTAAGNEGRNNDGSVHFYPCDYDLDNIICVAATDQNDELSFFSNTGSVSVDVGAPGQSIYSTVADISSTSLISINFESVNTGTIPDGWITGGILSNWGVLDSNISEWDNVLYADMNMPYANDVNSTISKSLDTSNASGVNISFWTMCDTEYVTNGWADYMAIEASADGSNFVEVGRWDEAYMDDDLDPSGSTYAQLSFDLTGYYSSLDFKIRFRWVSNGSDNAYAGCLIDDLLVNKYIASTINESYAYDNGTSMATPHVAGLVSLLWSANPSLNYSQIKNIVINSGDFLTSLSGKTVSGKRINVYNSLMALGLDRGPNIAQIYDAISLVLSGEGIRNNLDTVTTGNISSFSGLYFAAMSGADELGRITFLTGLDLTDTGTQNFLSGELPNAIGMEQGEIWFNPGSGFIGKNAILKMNLPISFSDILSDIESEDFVVREGSGGNLIGNDMIDDVYVGSCVGNGNYACPLYLAVDHFTAFELKPQLTNVNIKSNNSTNTSYARSGDVVTLSFTGSEILTGVSVAMNGITSSVVGTGISWYSSLEITGGTEENLITFIINYQDLDGNTGSKTVTTDASSVIVDDSVPVLSGAFSVTNTTSRTPSYSFVSDSSGIISYSGSCSSATIVAISGTNNITFASMSNATYSGCEMYVTDMAGNVSEVLIIPTFTVNYTAGGGGGGGGGGASPTCISSKLVCINGKYELKQGEDCRGGDLGKSCVISGANQTGLVYTGINKTGSNLSGLYYPNNLPINNQPKGSVVGSTFSREFNNAYLYAYKIGVTTIQNIQNANMEGDLIRAHMAKMMVNYMTKTMTGFIINTGRKCNFSDIGDQSNEMKYYIKLACQLDIMGVSTETFNPDGIVSRAEFATVLSRVLYGDRYNGGEPYYLNHLNVLKENGIIKNDDPDLKELRGYVMIMLMRLGLK